MLPDPVGIKPIALLYLLLDKKKHDVASQSHLTKAISVSCGKLSPAFNVIVHPTVCIVLFIFILLLNSGPCCSKLTTSLVNDLLKFTLSDTQIY